MQGEPSILCMHGVRTIWETNYKAIVQQFYVWHMNKYGFTCLATTGLTCSPFLRTTTVYSTLLTHYRYISKILLAVPFQNSKRLSDSPYNDLLPYLLRTATVPSALLSQQSVVTVPSTVYLTLLVITYYHIIAE